MIGVRLARPASSSRTSRLVVSKLLNHISAERNDITAVYDRASYDGDKRAALNSWAAKLEQIVSGETGRGKVLAFRA